MHGCGLDLNFPRFCYDLRVVCIVWSVCVCVCLCVCEGGRTLHLVGACWKGGLLNRQSDCVCDYAMRVCYE